MTRYKSMALALLAFFAAAAYAAPEARAAEQAPPAEKAQDGRIVVQMAGFRNDSGKVGVILFDESGKGGFPTDPERSLKQAIVRIRGGKARAVFSGLAPGVYAVAMVHDENSNDTLDLSLIGIPKEGYGASNDARSRIGPPDFDDARVRLKGGTLRLRIKAQYW